MIQFIQPGYFGEGVLGEVKINECSNKTVKNRFCRLLNDPEFLLQPL